MTTPRSPRSKGERAPTFGLRLPQAVWLLPAVAIAALLSRFAVPASAAPCFFFPLLSLVTFFRPRWGCFAALGLAPLAGVLRYLTAFPYFAPAELVVGSWAIGWLFARAASRDLSWRRTPLDVWVVLWAALVAGTGIVELRFGDAFAALGKLEDTSTFSFLWSHLYGVRGLLRPALVVASGIAAYVMVVQTLTTGTDRRLAVGIFVASAAGTGLFALGQYVLDFELIGGYRARASFVARNHLASFLVLAFGAGLGRLKSIARRGALFVPLAVILLALLVSLARAAWFSAGLITLLYGLSWVRGLHHERRKRALTLCLAAVTLLTVLLLTWAWRADEPKRFESLGGGILYNLNPARLIDAFSDRTEFWAAGWDAFSEHPIWGIGLGRFRTSEHIWSRIGRFRHAHSTFLNIAAELGLLGLCLWGALLCRWCVLVLGRLRSTDDRAEADVLHGLLLGVTGFLVTALADDPLFDSEGQIVFWCVLGLGSSFFAAPQRSPRKRVLLAGALLTLAMMFLRSPRLLSAEEAQELRAPAALAQHPKVNRD